VIKTRTLANGKKAYDVRLRSPDGKQVSETYYRKQDAIDAENAARIDKRRGAWTDPRFAKMTVADLGAQWMSSNPAKRSGSRHREVSILRLHVNPTLGAKPIGAVTQPNIQGLVNSWIATRQAPRTIKRQYEVVRAKFNFAVNADWLGRTPCRNIKLPRVTPLKRKLPDNDGLDRLALELGEYAPMFWVGVLTGLRWAEVAGLRVGSAQLLQGNLFITEQRTRDLDDDDVTAEPKSEAGIRPLAIDPVLAEILAEHIAARRLTAADSEQLLFVGRRGGPLNYSHWRQRVWVPACERASLPGLQFHDLRRVNATGMVAEGVDPKTAQVRFGHTDIRLTLGLYAQAVTASNRAAAQSLAARFTPRRRASSLSDVE